MTFLSILSSIHILVWGVQIQHMFQLYGKTMHFPLAHDVYFIKTVGSFFVPCKRHQNPRWRPRRSPEAMLLNYQHFWSPCIVIIRHT